MREHHPFLRAISGERDDAGRRILTFEESWYQGRGVYGGVVAGALARALAGELGEDDRPLRWLSVHFCAPAVGRGALSVALERRGASVTHASARIDGLDDGETIAFASASFARRRPVELAWRRPTMPAVAPPASIPPFTADPTPTFARHFELRFCHGPAPLSGGEVAEMGAWIRFAEPLLVDVPAALAILDAAPPAAMARFTALRPMATVALACQLFEPLPLADARADDHYLLITRSNVAGDGYTEELDELWSADGRLIALCWQHIALLG